MDWAGLIIIVVPPILTYLLGLVKNKPGYKKVKNVGSVLDDMVEDDKVDNVELQGLIDAISAKLKK